MDGMPPLVADNRGYFPPMQGQTAAFYPVPTVSREGEHHHRSSRSRRRKHSASGGGGGGGLDADWPSAAELIAPTSSSSAWPQGQGHWPGSPAGPGPYGGTPFAGGSPSLAPSDSISASVPVPAYAAYPIPVPAPAGAHYPTASYPIATSYPPAAMQAQRSPSPWHVGTYEPQTSSSAFKHTALIDSAYGWPAPTNQSPFSPPVVPSESLSLAYPPSPYEPTHATAPAQLPAPQPVVYQVPYSSTAPRYLRRASSEAPVQHALDTVQASGLADVADRRFFDRPGSWRPDFRMPRTGLEVLFPKKTKSISRAISERGPYDLSPKIRYTALREPPVVYDMRQSPMSNDGNNLRFRDLRRRTTHYDLSGFATEPPVPLMRLYHPRLPWYIDVIATDPVGVTLQNVFDDLWGYLHQRIHRSDFYNSDVSEEERAKIARSFRNRCGMNDAEVRRGVRKVDYLLRDCLFLGLSKGRDGMWEMRTRKEQ